MISRMRILNICAAMTLNMFVSTQIAWAQAVTPAEAQAAINLYKQKQYIRAADAFEKIIRRQCNATYCYYAALSSRAAHREMRAKQLFEYVVKAFPTSVEASYCKKVIGSPATADMQEGVVTTVEETADESGLPASVKALLPPEMQSMMNTPDGRRAVAEIMRQNSDKLSAIRAAEKSGKVTPTKIAAASMGIAPQPNTQEKGTGDKEHPFTAADIAKQGAAAIDQMLYPNCWFEASMAALAELPRGQRLIASMIRSRGKDTYVVRFPGDGVEYVITLEDLRRKNIHDSALWASLIECAQTRKFPDNEGANGTEGDMSRLEVGLGCITGCKAQVLVNLDKLSEGELSSFIGSAVKSQNPIVAGTHAYFRNLPYIAFPLHAYTITGFDPAKSMITIRNPHGRNSQTFYLPGDPNHLDFEQLDNGVFKMSIRSFQKYFSQVCRSFI